MKTYFLMLLLPCFLVQLNAQSTAKNSLSLSAGVNRFIQPNFVDQAPDIFRYHPKTGYQLSLEYAYTLTFRWAILAGVQYDIWQWAYEVRDHFIAHGPNPVAYLGDWVNYPEEDRAWMFYGGVRYSASIAGSWRWQAEALCGITAILTREDRKFPLRNMLQFGTGIVWQPGPAGLFIMPNMRYVSKELRNDSSVNYCFVIPSLNTGLRWSF